MGILCYTFCSFNTLIHEWLLLYCDGDLETNLLFKEIKEIIVGYFLVIDSIPLQ